jgi:hypothetical protein
MEKDHGAELAAVGSDTTVLPAPELPHDENKRSWSIELRYDYYSIERGITQRCCYESRYQGSHTRAEAEAMYRAAYRAMNQVEEPHQELAAHRHQWLVDWLRSFAGRLESENASDRREHTERGGINKYRSGALMQQRENLKQAANALEEMIATGNQASDGTSGSVPSAAQKEN